MKHTIDYIFYKNKECYFKDNNILLIQIFRVNVIIKSEYSNICLKSLNLVNSF